MTNLIEKVAGAVPSWGVKMAYGDSITLGGQELVPAALVVFGFGAGEGSGDLPDADDDHARRGEGSGGGGGGYVVPVGAYVGSPDGLRFRPNPIAVLIACVPLLAVAGWSTARIIRASR